jgi:uncharacterized membrane protein
MYTGLGKLSIQSEKWRSGVVMFLNVKFCYEIQHFWGLSLLAIFLSWTLVHTFFALYYARLYYDELSAEDSSAYRKGLDFPNQELVDYWDFMYYSFTIAMCYQTSDVSIESVAMRRMTLFHSILSFILVAVVIGLAVNIISNLI